MTSSMLAGEQRWASKRRGGMTVLGKVAKVAVPKPLNLPSQRLENRGLDPNVEIVPKGTLSWGSKPSSASSNAWATSALSPSTDGGSSSPSHLAGRPLSGGGNRPSTAGSEKAHDLNVNSWGPNSRPSSASGVLGSNHTSLTSLRPRSAETRPGSSHLSRFAEPSLEGSRTWGATASSERMGVSEGFSLSTGDFPSLGSEKDESRRNVVPLDASHGGRPGSSSGGVKSMSDSMEISHDDARDSDIKGHSWRNDCPPIFEDGPRLSMDRWHGDPHMFQNPNIGPPHYDSWRGPPPVNPSGGVWYRGPLGPPPYGGPGGPVPPGGFHMEPYPYYCPQVPTPVRANSQLIPPPGTGHYGHHPKNGDMYRPHMPESSFMRPGVPMRPGFYPAPVPYEGYYRPPMGFGNPNERDFPFMGMAAGPPMYNRPANQIVPDLNSSHPRPRENREPDTIDPGLLHGPRGDYNVLVKQDGSWNRNDEEKWSHRVTTDGSNHDKGILSKTNDSPDYGGRAAKDEVPFRAHDVGFHSSNPANSKLSGSVSNVEEPGIRAATDDLVSPRDHSLIQKIEGLNAKARASGGSAYAFHREQVVNVRAHRSVDEADTQVVLERHYPTGVLVPISRDPNVVASEKSGESVMNTGPRRGVHGAQNRSNRHGKGNFDGQEVSGWGRNSQSHSVEDHNSGIQPSEVCKANIEMKGDGVSAFSDFDRSDTQRAKMRELAKQRAIQLQKEEEERIREQKAKALAKLEELNRRSATQGAEVPSQKEIVPPHSTGPLKPDDSRDQPDLEANSNPGSSSVFSNHIAQINENGASKVVDSAGIGASPQVRDVSNHKRAGYKQRQSIPPEKNLSQDSIVVGQTDALKDHNGEYVNQEVTVGSKVDGGDGKEIPETPLVSDSPAPHKRRNNKSGKNKHKVEDSFIAVPSTVSPNNSDLGQAISTSVEDNGSNLLAKELSQIPGDRSSLPCEDVQGRVNNSRNAQHSWKPRSSQGNRPSEKAQSNDAVVWAPVRSHNKVEITDQTSQKAAEPEDMPQSSSKIKRAEMELYVPKPVAKELAQGSIPQPPSLSVDHPPISLVSQDFSGSGGREKAYQGSDSFAKVGPIVEGKNRHGRGQGSWRQRVSGGSNVAQASQYSSACCTSKDIVRPNESTMMEPPHRPTELSMKRPEDSVSDGWNIANDSSPKSSAALTGVKDQLPSGRGKKHLFKGQKGNSQSFGHKDSNAGLTDSHCATEINDTEKILSSKENRAVVDRSAPHWQPKSQVYVSHNQQGNRSHSGQNQMAEDNKGLKPDIGSVSVVHSQSQYNQSEDKAMRNIEHQEFKREKRGPHVKGHPNPPSQGLVAEVEPTLSEGADGRNEQRPSSGYRKNSNYSGRVNRVHESRGDWSTMPPESKHHYSSANPDRQRQNSHYEYQPVGPYNSNNSGSQTENQHGGPKFRERGYSRRGRGNFHGRQSGNE